MFKEYKDRVKRNKLGFQEIFKNKTYMIGKVKVCFPRGMDLSADYPGRNGRNYDLFFCHGNYDQKLIMNNTEKKVLLLAIPVMIVITISMRMKKIVLLQKNLN